MPITTPRETVHTDGRKKRIWFNIDEAFEFYLWSIENLIFVMVDSSFDIIQQQEEARIVGILVDDGDTSASKGSYHYL
jgi:hypothetical protein